MSGISPTTTTTTTNSPHRRPFFHSTNNNNEENASMLQVQQSWMTMSPPSGTIVSNSVGIHDEKEQPLGLQRQLSLSSTTLQQKQKELATFLPCRGSLLYCSPPRKALVDDGQNKEEGHYETVVSGNKSATKAGVMATADGAVHEVHSAAGPTLLKEAMSGAAMAGTTDCSKGKDEHCNSKKTQISWLLSHCTSSSSSSKNNHINQERSVLSATDQDDIDYLISLSMFESLISTTSAKTISINEEEKEESRATATSGSSTTQHVDSSSSSAKTTSPVCVRDIPSLYFPTLPEDLDEAVNDIATSMSIHQDSMMF